MPFQARFQVHFKIGVTGHIVPIGSTAELVERRSCIPEGASSNPFRVNSFC